MSSVETRSDGVLEQVADNLEAMPALVKDATQLSFDALGRTIKGHMQLQMEGNRYKGDLVNSVQYDYEPGNKMVTIAPTLMRGRFSAGTLLELGTRPIRNAPWKPIKEWADARGIPAFPVWYAIRTKGMKAHPWLQQTMKRSEPAILRAAEQIGELVAQGITAV